MSFSHLLTSVLWILPLTLQAGISAVMLRRGLSKVFPIFFGYTVSIVVLEIALFFPRYPSNLYSLIYLSKEVLAILLGLGAVFEIVLYLLPPGPFFRMVLRGLWSLATVLVAVAVLILLFTQALVAKDRVLEMIILAERSARFLQAGLLLVVIALMSRLGLAWHQYSVGILAGFGTYSALALIIFELRSHAHIVGNSTLALGNSAAYNVAALIWAFYFLRSWRQVALRDLPKNNLAEWNETVSAYVDQWHRRF